MQQNAETGPYYLIYIIEIIYSGIRLNIYIVNTYLH